MSEFPPAVSRRSSGGDGFSRHREVRQENPLTKPRWDDRLGNWPAAGVFHGTAWARVLHDSYGFEPIYLSLGNPSQPDGLLPLMDVRSWLTGSRGISLPFTDECEPLLDDPDSWRALFDSALGLSRNRGWRYLELRGGRRWLGDVPASTSFWGHRLDLREGESALFRRLESSGRRAIRKAGQSGLEVEVSRDLPAVEAFFSLLCRTRKRHGLPPQPYRFFRNIQRHVMAHDQGHVVLARFHRRPVAAAVYFHLGNRALYKFGASDERFQHLRGNNLVMWEAIKWFAGHGFETLDFGRTSLSNDGLRRFKLAWGTQERRIDYVRYDLRTDQFVTVRDDATGWHNRVFRVLPIFLSRLVGRAIYRHVA